LAPLGLQLGLKLVPNKATVEVLIVDRVEKPSPEPVLSAPFCGVWGEFLISLDSGHRKGLFQVVALRACEADSGYTFDRWPVGLQLRWLRGRGLYTRFHFDHWYIAMRTSLHLAPPYG
jgi:hypothetical protein